MYLLDTNTIIYFFKGSGNVANTFLSKSPKDIAVPSITLYELEVGVAKSVNPKKRKQQLESVVSLILDDQVFISDFSKMGSGLRYCHYLPYPV